MSDLKLLKLDACQVTELPASSMALEKSLQSLIERHLETFLGVTFLASEYSTGPKTGGRLDTLGIDENGAPVIIEYKKGPMPTSSIRACFIWTGFWTTGAISNCSSPK